MKSIVGAIGLFLAICTVPSVCQPVAELYRRGAINYDTVDLVAAYKQSIGSKEKKNFLFAAQCLWRIELVKYCVDDKKGIEYYGTAALGLLDSAEVYAEDDYMVNVIRCFVCQLLASTNFGNAAQYGPRSGTYFKKIKKAAPTGFYTRLINGTNLLAMPSFVGGDPQKGARELIALHLEFADSTPATLGLVSAYVKISKTVEAKTLLDDVLLKNPKNLWAKKLLRELK